jgi:hypothetical protein
MQFGTEFTELAATIGAKKNETGKTDDFLLTTKQWILVVATGIFLALGIDFWLALSGF